MKNVYILSVLFIAILLFYLMQGRDRDERSLPPPGAEFQDQAFDYFMEGVESLQLAADGSIQYRIRAARFAHYPELDYTDMTAPDVLLYHQEDPPWHITSAQGRFGHDQVNGEEKITLIDRVTIHRPLEENKELNIYTELLHLYPKSKTVNTDAEVRVNLNGSEIVSQGMTADLTSNKIRLLSEVRGHYE